MAPTTQQKHRVNLSYIDKCRIIKRLNRGDKRSTIAKDFCASIACIQSINRKKDSIIAYLGNMAAREIYFRRNSNPSATIFKKGLKILRDRYKKDRRITGFLSLDSSDEFEEKEREIEYIRVEMMKKNPTFYEDYVEGRVSDEVQTDQE